MPWLAIVNSRGVPENVDAEIPDLSIDERDSNFMGTIRIYQSAAVFGNHLVRV